MGDRGVMTCPCMAGRFQGCPGHKTPCDLGDTREQLNLEKTGPPGILNGGPTGCGVASGRPWLSLILFLCLQSKEGQGSTRGGS